MLEKPRLKDDKIKTCLLQMYGIEVDAIEFLPLGYDSQAGVYRVSAGGQPYFLKVKADTVNELSIRLPHYLKAQGIDQVVAPLPTLTQEPWGKVDHFTLILYPFIEARESALSDSQWIEFGTVLRKLHSVHLSAELRARVPTETFELLPKWRILFSQMQDAVENQPHDHPAKKQLAALWKDKAQELGLIIHRAEQLGRLVQHKPLDFVLCHADMHTGNLLLDPQGNLFIVDWDQPVLAPKERDLMFVTVGGFVQEKRLENLFFQGYGETKLDPLVMAYYRYERAMEDLLLFAEQVFLADSSDETKYDSLKWFTLIFSAGRDVEAAHEFDRVLGF